MIHDLYEHIILKIIQNSKYPPTCRCHGVPFPAAAIYTKIHFTMYGILIYLRCSTFFLKSTPSEMTCILGVSLFYSGLIRPEACDDRCVFCLASLSSSSGTTSGMVFRSWHSPFASATRFSITWFDPSHSGRASSPTRRFWHDEAMRQSTADDIVGLDTACSFL